MPLLPPRLFLLAALFILPPINVRADTPVRAGWLGPITGSMARFGVHQAAQLALEEVNRTGGINGRPLELIFEDGGCDGRTALAAAQKLLRADKVRFILGGHCTPESVPVAPLANQERVLMLGSMTSSPKLSQSGDYYFRITSVSTRLADVVAARIVEEKLTSMALLYVDTDYAVPVAQRLQELLRARNVGLPIISTFAPSETDFRALLTKVKGSGVKGLYVATQSPDQAFLLASQIRNLKLSQKLFSNDSFANSSLAGAENRSLFTGVIYAEPPFDEKSPETSRFIRAYEERYKTRGLPGSLFTAEAYDAVMLLARTIGRCGEDPESVRECLQQTVPYQGASGLIAFDDFGDGKKPYVLKHIGEDRAEALVPLD